MKHIKIVTAVIMTFHFSSATSEVSNSIQNSLMDLSGLSAITSIPKLETTKQRNQFFDNYSVLSIPDINIVDQVQLQNIQTFAPSHRQIGLDGLNKIKGITTGLTTQGVMVTPEDFKGIKIQNGKITVADMDSKSQGVKDIVGAANSILQEVKSLNQKELNSLKLTISDMKNIQKIMPIIQQQFDTPIAKDGKVNGVSVDVSAMNAEINNARQELNTLIPKLTFADFGHFMNASTSPNGKLILPNYNKDTASGNINRFIEISNQGSKYVDAGLLSATPSTFIPPPSFAPATFSMKGVDTITGKPNGFLNLAPNLGSVAASFQGVNTSNPMLGSARPVFNWVNQTPELLTQTMGTTSLGSINNGNSVASIGGGTSAFEYMNNTSFVTIDNLQNTPLSICISCSNDLGGLCGVGTACRQKLSIGDLVGALDGILENLPEGVTLR